MLGDSNSFSSKPAPKWCFEYGANKSVYFGHSMIVKTVVKKQGNEGWGGFLAKKFGPHVVKKITFQSFDEDRKKPAQKAKLWALKTTSMREYCLTFCYVKDMTHKVKKKFTPFCFCSIISRSTKSKWLFKKNPFGLTAPTWTFWKIFLARVFFLANYRQISYQNIVSFHLSHQPPLNIL